MNLREKLTKLLDNNVQCSGVLGIESCDTCPYRYEVNCYTAAIVDYLITHGVIIKEHEEIDFDYSAED